MYDAYDYLLGRRNIAYPNTGFLLQLIRFQNDIGNNEPMQNSNESKPSVDAKKVPWNQRKQRTVVPKTTRK